MKKIILFYKYINLDKLSLLREELFSSCCQLNLKGRVFIGNEGINGTLGGATEEIDSFVAYMRKSSLFFDVDFKESFAEGECFPKLKVKIRPEIVKFGADKSTYDTKNTGVHLTPHEVHELLSNKPDNLIILDARNNFESAIGKFENAITPDIEYFRQFPQYLDEHAEMFKDKQVLMYCTGGIRCELATAYLKSKNVAQKVYQIEGGIHRYIEQFPDGFFRGKNYVFDGRVAMKANEDILSNCVGCKKSCDEYINCINTLCNNQCIMCQPCQIKFKETCSNNCLSLLHEGKITVRAAPAKTACEIIL